MALLFRKLSSHVFRSSRKTISQSTKSETTIDTEIPFLSAFFPSLNEHVTTETPLKDKDIKTENKLNKWARVNSLEKCLRNLLGQKKNLVIIEKKDATLCIFPEAQAKLGLLKEDGQLENIISNKHAKEIEQTVCFYQNISKGSRTRNNLPQNQFEILNNGILYFSNQRNPTKKMTDDEYFGRGSESQLENVRDVLEKTLPGFFKRPVDYSIINPEIVFENNIWNKQAKGVSLYSMHLFLVKTLANFVYVQVSLKVLKVTTHPEQGTVKVRWRIVGLPQTKILRIWRYSPGKYRESIDTDSKWIDGLSTYHIGSDGSAYRHVVDNVIPDDEVPSLTEIIAKKAAPVEFMSKTRIQGFTVLEPNS